jgi:thiosulfate reductase cytochrome b subunit
VRRHPLCLAAVVVACLFVFTWAALDAAAAPPDCTKCHVDDAADKAKFALSAYRAGVHAKVECTLCHRRAEGFFDVVPHKKTEDDLTGCRACHGQNLKPFNKELMAGVHADLKCNECHDAHSMKRNREIEESSERTKRANAGCIRCHAKDDLAGADGPHKWLPSRERHMQMRCIVCHAPLGSQHDHEIVAMKLASRRCEGCHSGDAAIVGKYLESDDRSGWITNPVLFEKAYVPGAVRHRLVDAVILGIFGFTVVGALGHWLLRARAAARRPTKPFEVESTFLYARGLRLWHWTNAALIVGLAVTGLRIHFGGREKPILSFEGAFNFHNVAGVLLLATTVAFYVRNVVTGDARQYLGKPQDGMRGVLRQVGYYVGGIFRGEDHPYHATKERRFNPLQQMTYMSIMYGLVPLIAVSGIVLLYPQVIPERIAGKPGPWWFATAHYLLGAGLVAFLLGHLYLATTGDRASYLYRGMIDGFHRSHVAKKPPGDAPGTTAETPPPDETPEVPRPAS